MRILALSSSRVGGGAYLGAAVPMIKAFLGDRPLQIVFLPFAAADGDYEGYADKVREGLSALPHVMTVATPSGAKEVIERSDVIMVGGGNTFKLLHDIYRYDLFLLIQQKVKDGVPYIGWSAGANLAGPTICTTNDMPVVQPQSFVAFGFLPFQINPHYYNVAIEGFHGETRDQRLAEFLMLNPGVSIVGLPEGTALQRIGENLQLLGAQPAVLFRCNNLEQPFSKSELQPGADLSFLMH